MFSSMLFKPFFQSPNASQEVPLFLLCLHMCESLDKQQPTVS